MDRSDIYKHLDTERMYQDDVWGKFRNSLGVDSDDKISISEWILYMEKHMNQAKDMIYSLEYERSLVEIRKITAIGVKIMEIYGCPPRNISVDE